MPEKAKSMTVRHLCRISCRQRLGCNLSLAFSQSNCVSFSAEYGAVLAVLKDNFCKCGKTSSLPYGIFLNLLKLFATLRAHCTVIWYVYAKSYQFITVTINSVLFYA